MNPPPPGLAWLLGFVGLQRLLELALSARHERQLLARGGRRVVPDGFLLLVLVHAGLYVLVPIEVLGAPWARVGPWSWPALGVALAAMSVRYWAAFSLGIRYTVRVVRLPDVPLVATGPYRWIRHPIYRAVALEVVALPIVFGAWVSAAVLGALNLVALARRIRLEERALGSSFQTQ